MSARLASVKRRLDELVESYPEQVRAEKRGDIPRALFQLKKLGLPAAGQSLLDIGGGFSVFPIACAVAGYSTTVVDSFDYSTDRSVADVGALLFDRCGISRIHLDLQSESLPFESSRFDAVSCIAVIEHFHHSPRAMLTGAVRTLREGGGFLIGAPNCVNLRKRLTVPLGHGNWSPFDDWFRAPQFHGHVREPDLDDLLSIASDIGLEAIEAFGANWVGHSNRRRIVRAATRIVDLPLRAFPSLCGDIYVFGRKSSSDATRGARGPAPMKAD